MKLLLTSSGFENQSIIDALRELVGKDFAESKVVYIPTAANMEEGDKRWVIHTLVDCEQLGFQEIDIVDIAALPQAVWQPRLEHADVLFVGGGNTSYLLSEMKKSGLAALLPELLKTRVYVGTSAGSMVVAPRLHEQEMQRLYDEPIVDPGSDEGLGLVDFLIVPHLNSPYFPRTAELVDEVANDIDTPLYVLDDQSAVKVVDGAAEVVTEGTWKAFSQ